MQLVRPKFPITLLVIAITLLLGGMMFAAQSMQAAPVAQDSDDDTTASEIYLPLILAADGSTTDVPFSPEQYAADSEEAPVLSDEQIQASTWCSTYIKFQNESSYTVKIYWVNNYGSETLYKTLSSGSYYWQHTYYGHKWNVRDTSGNLLKSFTVTTCSYVYVTIDNNDFPHPTATPTATPTSPSGGACYTEIIATHSNKCMDVAGASTSNNAQIQQWSCSGGDNQKFFFSPVSGKADTYLIRAKHSGKAVDVLYGSTSQGKDLVQYSANGSSSQQWKIVNVGGDIYELKNINSGLLADVEGSSNSDGAHIIQWSDNNSANQRWKISSCLGQQPTPTNTPVPPTATPTQAPPTATPTKTPTTAPQLGSIGDRVWNDFDRDGIQDGGEPGVASVTVQLKNCSNTVLQTTTTDGNGSYTFGNLSASCYTIGIVTPGGFQISPKAQGTDGNLDSDINIGNAMSDNINLGAGQNITNIDAGINQPVVPTPTNTPLPQLGSIGDKVFRDANGNGIQDGGEAGVPGISVQLKDCSDNTLQTTTTDGNGNYSFNNLVAGCYVVRFVNVNSTLFQFSPANQGGNDALDSDVEFLDSVTPGIVNGQTGNINLGAGETNNTVDTGLVPQDPNSAMIGNLVFRDENGNGQRDTGEPGMPGVTVQLKDCAGNVLQTRTTDANGNYGFNNLAAGCYTVGVVLPGGFTFSPPNVGNDVSDSDINPGTAMTDPITLSVGESNNTVDAGLVPQAQNNATIGDKVFRDENGNGIQDGGEPGVSGVTVQLKDCSNNVLQTTTTDGNGNYSFNNLAAGCYTIGVVLPGGFTFSPANVGNDGTDSDVNPGTAMTDPITLGAGETNNTVDAGLVPQAQNNATIGDKVFRDENGNGIQDGGEPGVSGVTVQLKDCSNNVLQTRTTDGNGNYSFSNLAAGCYTVGVVLPGGFTFSPANVGNDGTDSDVNSGTAMTDPITLGAGETNNTVDAGLVPETGGGETCIGNYVWYDMDMDGIQDGNEMGVVGADVYLGADTTGDGRINAYYGNMQTDANGAYLFCGLNPAIVYSVEFVPPMGCGFTLPNVGTDDTIDSDPDISKGVASGIVVVDGVNNDTIDAGFVCVND